MNWPWQRLRASDEIIACTCGSTLPALPQAPLANMVRRGTRIVRINTGFVMQCLQCNQRYFISNAGPHKGLIVKREEKREPMPAGLGMGPGLAEGIEEMAQRMGKRVMPVFSRDEMRERP